MSFAFVVLNGAYVALLASTFTRTLTKLRIVLVLAAAAFVLYGVLEAIWSMVMWNFVTGSMHLFRIVRDYRQQRSVTLTSEERALRDEFLPDLGDFDFHLLWCMGTNVEFSDELMIRKGSTPETVSVVLDGTVVIRPNDEVTRGIRRGGLVGEMSFVSGMPAQVDVLARGDVRLHQWDQRQLSSLDQLHPASARAFRQMMSRDLAAKAQAKH